MFYQLSELGENVVIQTTVILSIVMHDSDKDDFLFRRKSEYLSIPGK